MKPQRCEEKTKSLERHHSDHTKLYPLPAAMKGSIRVATSLEKARVERNIQLATARKAVLEHVQSKPELSAQRLAIQYGVSYTFTRDIKLAFDREDADALDRHLDPSRNLAGHRDRIDRRRTEP